MIFRSIRFKNILSFGNKMTEIQLDTNNISLISGLNGRGKSTVLEAIYFAYSGRPFRKIKKSQLVNTLNRKDLLVELDIEEKGSLYTIRRGVKPDIFEIYRNGELISEDSNVRDYQTVMETMFGVSAKTIRQTILMSSRFYTPFLELKPTDKRDFIENILSITVFSQMAELLRSNISSARSKEKLLLKDIDRVKSNIKLLDKIVKQQQSEIEVRKKEIQIEIDEINDKIEERKGLCVNLNNEHAQMLERIEQLSSVYKKRVVLDKKISTLKYQLKDITKNLEFFQDNDVCPVCKQDIDEDFKGNKIESCTTDIETYKSQIDEVIEKLTKFEQVHAKISELNESLNDIAGKVVKLNAEITGSNNQIIRLQKEFNQFNNPSVNNTTDRSKFDNELETIQQDIVDLRATRAHMVQTVSMLSEKGIKKYIINKYVPILNGLVNDYLSLLEAPYSIIFNEELEEQIVARGYEKLGYGNFSAGEKQRCDLALLFAFLELSRMKNSVDTNLVFFDEVLDNSLDDKGLNGVFKIFHKLKQKGYTVMVISHRENLDDKFESVLRIEKKRFSYIQ